MIITGTALLLIPAGYALIRNIVRLLENPHGQYRTYFAVTAFSMAVAAIAVVVFAAVDDLLSMAIVGLLGMALAVASSIGLTRKYVGWQAMSRTQRRQALKKAGPTRDLAIESACSLAGLIGTVLVLAGSW